MKRDLSIGFWHWQCQCEKNEKYHGTARFGPVIVEIRPNKSVFRWKGLSRMSDDEVGRIASAAMLRHVLLRDGLVPATDRFMQAEFWQE